MVNSTGKRKLQKIAILILGAVAGSVLIWALISNFDQIRRWQKKHFGSVPAIEAVVEAVKANDRLVVLSVGKDQQVHEGFEFTIYHRDKTVGTVQVTKVYENLCGARILSTAPGETIRIGDKAATWR
jgi:hypothetical protein